LKPRRLPIWVVAVAVGFHLLGMVRSNLPAQDGLKFLRFAAEFHRQPWLAVLKDCDQHPLYPATIAVCEPVVSLVLGHGPETWRLTGQLVSTTASILLLFPLFGLAMALFGDRAAATLAALLWALLPLPIAVGHDTLSDPLALLSVATALWLGESALRTNRLAPGLWCGIVSGLGYLARPEVAVVPVAVMAVAGARALLAWSRAARPTERPDSTRWAAIPSLSGLALSFLVIVGIYGIAKEGLSEKLSVRRLLRLPSPHALAGKKPHPLPESFSEGPWNFDPKEESGHNSHIPFVNAVMCVANGWVQGMGWAFALFALWGAARVSAGSGKWLIVAYIVIFAAAAIRHATALGYLSERHELSIVLASLPWAAAGAMLCGRRLLARMDASETRSRRLGMLGLTAIVALAFGVQLWKPGHPSRWGHGAAGRWLAEHAQPGDKVLDTRGWARFVSKKDGYDYWHVRQAVTDHGLAYFVVTAEELAAPSLRAKTLRAVLDYTSQCVATFPGRKGGAGADVLVYRYHCPATWEGLRP
jgi:Dolichyl-phosphate-mannose-protein mannosyltransferase